MGDKNTSLLQEPELGEEPKALPYPDLLKELARQAMERRPRYSYRGKTADQVRARLAEARRALRRCLGLAPRALPAKPTRVMERPSVQFDGFSIKPLAIERGSGWYITAHLYLPDGLRQPAPAVMHVHGHSYDGKSGASYARRCRGLARRGFVSLFVDFPGADEREGTGHALWYPVQANLPLQAIMVEDNSAAFTYLAGLPMVDEKRIGVTGSSGGGNQTVYFCAADGRAAASAPSNAPCLIWEHCNSGSSAYCHCEAVPGLGAAGLEYHDLLAVCAPRPVRVFAGVRDSLFPIVGARRAVWEADVAYRALGARGRCTIEEHYCEHACPADFREGVYRFFEQALKRPGDVKGPGDEGEDVDLSDPRLRALPERPRRFLTVADLYRARLREARPKRPSAAQLRRLLGRPGKALEARCLLRVADKEWSRVLLQVADGAVLPLVMRNGAGPALLAIADHGKEEALQRIGRVPGPLVSFDLRGQGETAPSDDMWYQRASHYLAVAGEPLPGGRVTDLLAVVSWLRREGRRVSKLVAFGGEVGLLACLAATIARQFPPLELHGMARSLRDAPGLIGQIRYTAWVPGLALLTDVPQLLAGLGKRASVKQWLEPGAEPPREGYT
jgi:poly(3-hydroxybutyrate) depolymerase